MASQELLVTLGLSSSSFSKKMKEILKEVKQLDIELEEANNSVKDFGKTQEGVANKVKNLESKLSTLNKATELCASEKEKLTKALNESQKAFEKFDKEVETTRKTIERENATLEEIKKNQDNLKAGLKDLQKSYKSTEKEISKMENSLSKELNAHAKIQEQYDKKLESLNKVKSRYDKLSETVDKQTTKFEKNSTALANVSNEVKTLRQSIDLTENMLKSTTQEVERLTNELDQAKKAFGKNSQEAKLYAEQLKSAKSIQSTYEKDLKGFNKELKKSEELFTSLSATVERQGKTLDSNKTKLAEVSAKLESASNKEKEYSNKVNESVKRVQEKEASLQSLKNKLDSLDKSITSHKNKIESASEEYKSTKKYVSELEKELTQLETELSKSERALMNNASKLKTVNVEYAQTRASVNKLNLELAETKKQLATLKWNNLSKDLGEVSNKLSDIGGAFMDVGSDLAMGVSAPLAAFYTASMTTFTSFEQQLYKVNSILGDTTMSSKESFKVLEEQSRKFAKETEFTASEVAQAYQYMAMAGWDLEKSTASMNGVLALSSIGMVDLSVASDIVTDSMTSFAKSEITAQQFTDIFAKTITIANTNVEMMGETLKYVAPVMGSLGASFEDTSIAIGLMANAGIKASSAGTALASGFTRLVKPTDKAQALMDKYGIAVQRTEKGKVDLLATMKNLRAALQNEDEANKAVAVSTIFGLTAMKGWLPIINATDEEFNKMTDSIYNAGGTTEQVMAEMGKSTAYTFKILMSNIQDLLISVGTALAPAVNEVAKWLTKVTAKFSEWVQNMQENHPTMLKIIGAFSLLAIAIPPVVMAMGTFIFALSNIANAGSVFSKVMGNMKGKLFEFGKELTTFDKLEKKLGSLKNKFLGFGKQFLGFFKNIKGLAKVFKSLGGFLTNPLTLIAALVAGITALSQKIGENRDALTQLGEKWGWIGEIIAQSLETINGITDSLFAPFKRLVEYIPKLFDSFRKGGKTPASVISDMFNDITADSSKALTNMNGEFSKSLKNIRTMSEKEFKQMKTTFAVVWKEWEDVARDGGENLSKRLATQVQHMDNTMIETLRGTSETMSYLFAGISDTMSVEIATEQFKKNIKNMVESGSVDILSMQKDFKNAFDLMEKNFEGSSEGIKKTAQDMFKGLAESQDIDDMIEHIMGSMEHLNDSTLDALTSMGGTWKRVFLGINKDTTKSTDELKQILSLRLQTMARENPKFLEQMRREMNVHFTGLSEDAKKSVDEWTTAFKEAGIVLSDDVIYGLQTGSIDIKDFMKTIGYDSIESFKKAISEKKVDVEKLMKSIGELSANAIDESMDYAIEKYNSKLDNMTNKTSDYLVGLQESWGGFGEFLSSTLERVMGIFDLFAKNAGILFSYLPRLMKSLMPGGEKPSDVWNKMMAEIEVNTAKSMSNVRGEFTKSVQSIKTMTEKEFNQTKTVFRTVMNEWMDVASDGGARLSERLASQIQQMDNTMISTLRGTSNSMAILFKDINENMNVETATVQFKRNIKNMVDSGLIDITTLDREFKVALDNMDKYFEGSSQGIKQTAQNMFSGLAEADSIGGMIEHIISSMDRLNDSTLDKLTGVGDTWKRVFLGINKDTTKTTEELEAILRQRFEAIARDNPQFIEQMQKEMSQHFDKLKENGKKASEDLSKSFEEAGMEAPKKLKEGLESGAIDIETLFEETGTNSIEGFTSAVEEGSVDLETIMTDIGSDIGSGLSAGAVEGMISLPESVRGELEKLGITITEEGKVVTENFKNSAREGAKAYTDTLNEELPQLSGVAKTIQDQLSGIDSVRLGNVTKQLSEVNKWLNTVKTTSAATKTSLTQLTLLKWGNTTKGLSEVNKWLKTVSSTSTTTRSTMIGLTNLPFGNTTKGLSEIDKWLKTVERAASWTRSGLRGITEITYGKVTKGLSEVSRWLDIAKSGANGVKNALIGIRDITFGKTTKGLSEINKWLNTIAGSSRTASAAISNVKNASRAMPSMDVATEESAVNFAMPRSNLDMSKFKTTGGWYSPRAIATPGAASNTSSEDIKTMRSTLEAVLQQNQLLMSLVGQQREIVTYVNVDGRQVARASARYMENEIASLNKRRNRLGGI